MKLFSAVLFLFTTSFTASKAQGDEKNYYSRRYDSIDVNTIFRSSRLLNNYVDCLLDKKPCPPEGKDLKSKKSKVLQRRCSRKATNNCALC
jgi:Insect pheromone-binding family, A10/OS-D